MGGEGGGARAENVERNYKNTSNLRGNTRLLSPRGSRLRRSDVCHEGSCRRKRDEREWDDIGNNIGGPVSSKKQQHENILLKQVERKRPSNTCRETFRHIESGGKIVRVPVFVGIFGNAGYGDTGENEI